jgi:hypothetical protein
MAPPCRNHNRHHEFCDNTSCILNPLGVVSTQSTDGTTNADN